MRFRLRKKKKTMAARIASAGIATPRPIPIFAPVDNPSDESSTSPVSVGAPDVKLSVLVAMANAAESVSFQRMLTPGAHISLSLCMV